MTLVMVLLTILVVAGVAAVASGVVSGGLGEPSSSIPARALPDPPLTGQDVADLRFVQSFRGYRMDQVDAAMDSLAAELDRLRSLLPEDVRNAPLPESAVPEPAGPVPIRSESTSSETISSDSISSESINSGTIGADPVASRAESD